MRLEGILCGLGCFSRKNKNKKTNQESSRAPNSFEDKEPENNRPFPHSNPVIYHDQGFMEESYRPRNSGFIDLNLSDQQYKDSFDNTGIIGSNLQYLKTDLGEKNKDSAKLNGKCIDKDEIEKQSFKSSNKSINYSQLNAIENEGISTEAVDSKKSLSGSVIDDPVDLKFNKTSEVLNNSQKGISSSNDSSFEDLKNDAKNVKSKDPTVEELKNQANLEYQMEVEFVLAKKRYISKKQLEKIMQLNKIL